jgi:hypothetical protein
MKLFVKYKELKEINGMIMSVKKPLKIRMKPITG